MKKVLAAVLWVARGFHNYGFTLGDMTHQFPEADNRGVAYFTALAGPLALPPVFLITLDKHWLLTPYTTERRWQEFHKEFPSLDHDEFERTWN